MTSKTISGGKPVAVIGNKATMLPPYTDAVKVASTSKTMSGGKLVILATQDFEVPHINTVPPFDVQVPKGISQSKTTSGGKAILRIGDQTDKGSTISE